MKIEVKTGLNRRYDLNRNQASDCSEFRAGLGGDGVDSGVYSGYIGKGSLIERRNFERFRVVKVVRCGLDLRVDSTTRE